jgi:pimeloyl-ACP methyl ester carboxylesterase
VRRSAVLLLVVFGIIAAAARADVPRWNVWLCRPGLTANWCNTDLSVTAYRADGTKSVVTVPDTRNPPVDCFYLYPTVSTEKRGNSDLKIGREEKYIALTQAARFSQVCRVFAPLYRQTTVYGNGNHELAYQDVLTAWRDYLAHWNNGRGVVLIGHSQGAGMLERLIQEQYASMRKQLVSALLLGGGVSVGPDDRFAGVPACRSTTQTGCVVAYSSWKRTPPKDAGEEGVGSSTQHVLCVNPASPAGGSAPITPIFPWFEPEGIIAPPNPQPKTFWVSLPGLYTARCVRDGQRSWLLVSRTNNPSDGRPTVAEVLGPRMGLHAADVNIALAELVGLVHNEAIAYAAHH